MQAEKSLTSTNFWFSIISLFTISLSVVGIDIDPSKIEALIPAIESKQLTSIVITGVGAIMALYNVFKNQKAQGGFKELFNSRNWWTSLIIVIGGIVSLVTTQGDFPIDQAEQIVDAVKSGNVVLIVTALYTFGQTIYFMFFKKETETI